MVDFKSRIKSRIDKKGLNTQAFADLCGLPVSSVKNILLGTVKNPRYETIKAIADALGTTPEELITGKEILRKSEDIDEPYSITNPNDKVNIDRFIKSTELVLTTLENKNISISKNVLISIIDEVYEYIQVINEKKGRSIIKKSHIEWIIDQATK